MKFFILLAMTIVMMVASYGEAGPIMTMAGLDTTGMGIKIRRDLNGQEIMSTVPDQPPEKISDDDQQSVKQPVPTGEAVKQPKFRQTSEKIDTSSHSTNPAEPNLTPNNNDDHGQPTTPSTGLPGALKVTSDTHRETLKKVQEIIKSNEKLSRTKRSSHGGSTGVSLGSREEASVGKGNEYLAPKIETPNKKTEYSVPIVRSSSYEKVKEELPSKSTHQIVPELPIVKTPMSGSHEVKQTLVKLPQVRRPNSRYRRHAKELKIVKFAKKIVKKIEHTMFGKF